MSVIRITAGIGSNPKAWAVLDKRDMVGEFDLSDEPGWIDEEANGWNGMTGIIWLPGRVAETTERKCYASIEEWAADIAAMYPDAGIVWALGEKPNWP